MDKLKITSGRIAKKDIPQLHKAFAKLNLTLDAKEVKEKTLGKSTIAAIKKIQKANKIEPTGTLDSKTVEVMNTELLDVHYTKSKTRTAKFHALLERLEVTIPKEEKKARVSGPETRKAIKKLQKEFQIKADGKVTESLLTTVHEKVIEKQFRTKTQIGKLQSKIQSALKIAKLPVVIDEEERKEKRMGDATATAIKALQTKYKLTPTGRLNKPTLDKIQSIAASKGVPKQWIKKTTSTSLTPIKRKLSVNKKGKEVAALQRALVYKGYKIDAKEWNTQTFGKTTFKAVKEYQRHHQLPQTGVVTKPMTKRLNTVVKLANPEVKPLYNAYRIKGSVRDELHQRKGNMVLHIYEKLIDGESKTPLMTKKNHSNGFFDIIYNPPIDSVTGLPKQKFHLVVKLLNEKDEFITSKVFYNAGKTQWVNFNLSGEKYQGDSQFSTLEKILQKALEANAIVAIKETEEDPQITQLSIQTGITTDDLMSVILSHHVAQDTEFPEALTAEVCYAFIAQHLPENLPGDLLRATNDWETFPQLVELAKTGIIFIEDALVEETLTQAISDNIVSLVVKQNKEAILQAFKKTKEVFVLNKPILIGNANLSLLLDESAIATTHYTTVANLFLTHKGINDEFWEAIEADVTITNEEIKDFSTTVTLGNITKNHVSTLQLFKKNIGNTEETPFASVSDVAKLSEAEIVTFLTDNGAEVPDNMPGETPEERIETYANVIQARAEFNYPMVAMVAAVQKGNAHPLQQVEAVQKFVDEHEGIDFLTQNLDAYLQEQDIALDDTVKEEVKVFQRIHKLTSKSTSGKVLIEEGLHSSARIYALSPNRLTNIFEEKGVEAKYAIQIYEQAKSQYAQVLAKLMEYIPQIHWGTPQAIIPQTYTTEELKEALGDIPNLESLFGNMDFCACEHCKSLYGPAAYFTDLLRFLKAQDSLIKQSGKTLNVKEVLLDRRPDLGKIKLNCENTGTPLPYIDLVCELLEQHIAPQQLDFDFQTTLSAAELRAIPQHIRPHAYTTLATADYPMNSAFNLWQEETRTYLKYLRVPRYELMEAFQDRSNPASNIPTDAGIAAEYFGISSHETAIITTAEVATPQLNSYWGINTTVSEVSVATFLDRTQLSYEELLELLMVRFLNDPTSASRSVIKRSVDTCAVATQVVTNMDVTKFDLMHRFIRLWRKTEWKMWELDLLLRNPKIGASQINEDTLINLRVFKTLQETFRISFEIILAFYEEINTEERISPVHADIKIPNLYDQLFRNITITNPLDPHFETLPLDSSIVLGDNTAPFEGYTPIPTILSALAITQETIALLLPKTDGKLSLASLSIILRNTYLAKGLKISVTELALLTEITGITDPFVDIQQTVALQEALIQIQASGFSISELHYTLQYSPEAPIGLREASIAQFIAILRTTLVKNKEIIDGLGLTNPLANTVLNFDADALVGLSEAQLLLDIQPLRDALTDLSEGFITSNFGIQEMEYILQFDPASGADTQTLVSQIKGIQEQIHTIITQNTKQILAHIAGTFNFSEQQAEVVLNHLILPGQTDTLAVILEDEVLMARTPEGDFTEISKANFTTHFNVYELLHKISIVLQHIPIPTKDLEWMITNHSVLGTLDFASLPITAVGTSLYTQWEALFRFVRFMNTYPEPEETSFTALFDMAKDTGIAKTTVLETLSILTQWNEEEVKAIDNALQLKHEPGTLDYTNYHTYARIERCMAQLKLTGVTTTTMVTWADRETAVTQQEIALQTRLAIKSKYENEEWLQKITPLQDELREQKRKALVAYHLEESQRTQSPTVDFQGETIPNPLFWKDTNDLFTYLLIDVEMSACQLTSRIKQGISSIQLFVQRCFLNLENRYVQVGQEEKEDVTSENAWSQWKWMKVYRIWEANRKVFFYPENWIEPELRDDKSPFFEELENELLQNEITHDNVETAYLSYLHKVDEVSNLEVSGVYHQREELNSSELGFEIDSMHVVARTKAIPHIYYYRKYDLNYKNWTAWEKIDVDIEGDQVVPVVYNRKLHLFWLVFTEKAQKNKKIPPAAPSSGPQDAPEPQKLLEIQLGWSIQKENGWSPKKIGKDKMIHPWERPRYAYNLKPYYKSVTNELWMDIYLSTTKEFNNRRFHDPIENKKVYVTRNRFNETYRPWHSSSFVFNGDIKELNLRGLHSRYHFEIFGQQVDITLPTTSYTYVHENFEEEGTKIKPLKSFEDGPRLRLPYGMHFHNTKLTNNKVQAKNTNTLRMLRPNGTSPTLLTGALDPFTLVITQQDAQLGVEHPMFYQDAERSFFITPEIQKRFDQYGQLISSTKKYRFRSFYHPYTTMFLRELNRDGIDGILNRKVQLSPQGFVPKNNFNFNSYQPNHSLVTVDPEAQHDRLDFSFGGAYSIYNWETFFHAPLMIANTLMQHQRFEEAMRWFHYIFDPTNIEALPTPQRYWITKPFFEHNSNDYRKQRIENILSNINDAENKDQLTAWRNNPFQPHLIARYRPVAYQRNVVMKYLDNLIAWGDQLFRRDSIESINEASLLYMLAYEILGDRPQKVPNVNREALSFDEIEGKLDDFGNASVDVVIEDTLLPIEVVTTTTTTEPMPNIETFYFCIPNNDVLLKYWDTVEDRLFKIRHCMNIDGVVRQLPLFQPPIDPALLVKAAAAGMDLNSVLNDITAGTPYYRFRVVVQKALEFANDVKQLGDKLLSILEKKDAEALSLLRKQHEIQLLEAIKGVREYQIDEAVEILGAAQTAKAIAEEKRDYYTSREAINGLEKAALILSGGSVIATGVAGIHNLLASFMHWIPTFSIGISGFGGTPNVTMSMGGSQAAGSMQAQGSAIQSLGSMLSQIATMLNTVAGYNRRKDDWDFQGRLATIEIDQAQFQINAAEIRQSIAEKELENQELQITNAIAEEEYMQSKYTNAQLYNWMLTQISTVYFQSYQLAYDMAKKAEQCYRYELGIQDSSYIQFGYWDSLKKGLLSGDKLIHDIRRLEAAYLDQNKRELELTKHISLAQMAPLSLLTLKETGQCVLSLPEWLFNMDYPGHYMRRIKTVSVSIPCIAGPYTSVNCTLTLTKNETRIATTLSGGVYEKVDENDIRFKTQLGSISSIATSHGQTDAGMFQLNFNDERYLPFEGAGVISEWLLNMPIENNQFDFSSISDVIVHVSYTARDGGSALAQAANAVLQSTIPDNAVKLFSVKHEFPNEWHKFLHPNGEEDQEFVVELRPEHYPFFLQGNLNTLEVKKLEVFLESSQDTDFEMQLKVTNTDYEGAPTDVSPNASFNHVHYSSREYAGIQPEALGTLQFKLRVKGATDFTSLTATQIDDLFLLFYVTT